MEPIVEPIKTKKSNPWLEFVKEVRDRHPDKTYKEILVLAKETYTKVEKPKVDKPKKEKSPKVKDEQ